MIDNQVSTLNLSEFISSWQSALDSARGNGRGLLLVRQSTLKQYVPRRETYTFRHPSEENDDHLREQPNLSGLSSATANELYRYGRTRLLPIVSDLSSDWDCEVFRCGDGTFAVSFYNTLGGRLTVHGIAMTKNWCGVLSDKGIIAQS